MAAGKIRQSFYLAKVCPLLHSFPPPSRIPQATATSQLTCPPLFFFKVFIFGETHRAAATHIPLLQVQGGQPFPEDLLIGSGAKGTTDPPCIRGVTPRLDSCKHFSQICPTEVRQSQPQKRGRSP